MGFGPRGVASSIGSTGSNGIRTADLMRRLDDPMQFRQTEVCPFPNCSGANAAECIVDVMCVVRVRNAHEPSSPLRATPREGTIANQCVAHWPAQAVGAQILAEQTHGGAPELHGLQPRRSDHVPTLSAGKRATQHGLQ